MEGSGPHTGRQRTRKTDTRRRTWSVREEEVLIKELHDIVINGWKCENGFRPGYLQQLEQSMIKQFPGTDLRGEPHINSKITVWKRQHNTLITLLSKTGIEWNDRDKMIHVNIESIFQYYCKIDKEARKMRFKSYPLLDDWNIIFGKDRVTGEFAEDITDAARDSEPPSTVNEVTSTTIPTEVNTNFNEDADVRSAWEPTSSGSSVHKNKKRRRTSDDGFEKMVDVLREFNQGTQEKLGVLITNLNQTYELSKKRDEIFGKLGKISWLGLNERIRVANYLSNNNNALQLIFSMPDDARSQMVRMIIDNNL